MLPAQRLLLLGRSGLVSAATSVLGTTPYHYWDFTSDRALFAGKDVGGVTSTPGWSFTRASTGYANQTPNAEFGSQNLVLQSQTLATTPWGGSSAGAGLVPTVTNNFAAAPDGTTTATRLQCNLNGGATAGDQSANVNGSGLSNLLIGVVHVLSFYAKLNSGSSQTMYVQDSSLSLGATGIAVTNVWTRYTVTATASAATSQLRYGLRGTISSGNTLDILLWGFQIEPGTTATTYKPTTTVAVTDVSGPPLVSFGSGVLRRTNKGALIEGAGTNLCLQSQTFGTTWTVVGSAQTADQFAAPDATTTGDQITATAGLSAHYTTQNFTWTAAVHTVSVYAKYVNNRWFAITTFDGTTSRNASFDLLNGVVGALSNATSTIAAVGGGWYRCTMTGSTAMAAAAGNIAFNVNATNVATNESYTALGTEIVGLWGAQIEAQGWASSYVPTTTASATRAADVLTVSSPGVTYPLSLFAEFERVVDTGGDENAINAWFNLSNNAMLRVSSTDLSEYAVTAGGATVATETVAGALALATTYKQAVRVQTNDFKGARGGTLTTGDTVGALPTNPTSLSFGVRADGILWSYGYIRRAAVFSSALNDAALTRATS